MPEAGSPTRLSSNVQPGGRSRRLGPTWTEGGVAQHEMPTPGGPSKSPCRRAAKAVLAVCFTTSGFVGSLSCAEISDRERFEPEDEPLEIVRTVPEAQGREVDPTVRIDLCLSDLADPRTVSDTSATVSSGAAVVDSRLTIQLLPWTAPGGVPLPPGATAPWCDGSVLSVAPKAPLPGGVRFRVRLRSSIVGWAGQTFDTSSPGWTENEEGVPFFFLEFEVADIEPEPEPESPTESALTLTDLFAPGAVFDPSRALCSCHQQSGTTANALLDLSTPDAAFEGLVVPGRIRDTGFPMVTPRRPSESFLLQKVLREGPDAIFGVLGNPMPPERPLPYADYVQLARWIESGAEL